MDRGKNWNFMQLYYSIERIVYSEENSFASALRKIGSKEIIEQRNFSAHKENTRWCAKRQGF